MPFRRRLSQGLLSEPLPKMLAVGSEVLGYGAFGPVIVLLDRTACL